MYANRSWEAVESLISNIKDLGLIITEVTRVTKSIPTRPTIRRYVSKATLKINSTYVEYLASIGVIQLKHVLQCVFHTLCQGFTLTTSGNIESNSS